MKGQLHWRSGINNESDWWYNTIEGVGVGRLNTVINEFQMAG